MKKNILLLTLVICLMGIMSACGNATTETETKKTDSAVNKDTINRDSENFSAPH